MATPVPRRPKFALGYTAGPDEPFEPDHWERIEGLLRESPNYWVSTVRPDGRPHAAPVWGVWLASEVWFSTSPDSVKAHNLAAQPAAVIHLESGDDVVILEGRCEAVSREHELIPAFVADYKAKYGFKVNVRNPFTPIYRFHPERASTWIEPNFPRSNARWTL